MAGIAPAGGERRALPRPPIAAALPGSRAGMTLVEALVVLVILMLVGAGVSRVLASGWESQATLTAQEEAQRRAQQGIDAVVDALRAGKEVRSGSDTSVTVRFPADNDRTYSVQNGNLVFLDSVTGETKTVCGDVTSFTVRYGRQVSGVWTTTSTPAAAESLELSIAVTIDGRSAVETSIVQLRNKALSG